MCIQVPCVYLLSAASTVIRNSTSVVTFILRCRRISFCSRCYVLVSPRNSSLLHSRQGGFVNFAKVPAIAAIKHWMVFLLEQPINWCHSPGLGWSIFLPCMNNQSLLVALSFTLNFPPFPYILPVNFLVSFRLCSLFPFLCCF